MTTPQTLLFAALFLCLGLFAAQISSPARAQSGIGPFYLMQHSNPTATAGVFRIDSATGEVSYCYISPSNTLVCSSPVK